MTWPQEVTCQKHVNGRSFRCSMSFIPVQGSILPQNLLSRKEVSAPEWVVRWSGWKIWEHHELSVCLLLPLMGTETETSLASSESVVKKKCCSQQKEPLIGFDYWPLCLHICFVRAIFIVMNLNVTTLSGFVRGFSFADRSPHCYWGNDFLISHLWIFVLSCALCLSVLALSHSNLSELNNFMC